MADNILHEDGANTVKDRSLPPIAAEPPQFAPAAAVEDLLSGARILHRAFHANAARTVERGESLVEPSQRDPEVLLITKGFAYRACILPNGRRAIPDILTVGDIVGLENLVLAHTGDDFVAASHLSYLPLAVSELRRLMVADPALALRVCGLLAEARQRDRRLALSINMDAKARICFLLLDIYNRLRRQELIKLPTYNLPLTQEEIANHLGLTMVHVNRTLRKLREEGVVFIDRQVVMIRNLPRLRELAAGQLAEWPEQAGMEGVAQ